MKMLDKSRDTVEIANGAKRLTLPVKAGAKGYKGGIAMLDAGYVIAGKKGTDLITLGRLEESFDNSGAGGTNGAISVQVKRGPYLYNNDITNPVTAEHVMKDCYVFDDETVTSLATGASVAGKVLGFENGQVKVALGV
jgi:hypothetical protein